MATRLPNALLYVAIGLAFSTSASADPQLADLLFLLPKILLLAAFIYAVKALPWVLLALAVGAALRWKLGYDVSIPVINGRRNRLERLGLLEVSRWLLYLILPILLIGTLFVDPIIQRNAWFGAPKVAAPSAPPASVPAEVLVKIPTRLRNPMGGEWPKNSGLITGMVGNFALGGALEIDNRAGLSAVYVKLCAASGRCVGVRNAYVRAGERFRVDAIEAAQNYHIRYAEVQADDGLRWGKSAAFAIETERSTRVVLPVRPEHAPNLPVAISPSSAKEFE